MIRRVVLEMLPSQFTQISQPELNYIRPADNKASKYAAKVVFFHVSCGVRCQTGQMAT